MNERVVVPPASDIDRLLTEAKLYGSAIQARGLLLADQALARGDKAMAVLIRACFDEAVGVPEVRKFQLIREIDMGRFADEAKRDG